MARARSVSLATSSRAPRSSVPSRSTWRPGQPCDWGRSLAVVAAFNREGRSSFLLPAYVGAGRKLFTSIGHAEQWSKMMMGRYPGFFSDRDREDALEMIGDAGALLKEGDDLEKNYDANRSWFGVRLEPQHLSKRKMKHKSGGYTYKCRAYPHCTRFHPSDFLNYAAEHTVRWRLGDDEPDWGAFRFRSNSLNRHRDECCKDFTIGRLYFSPMSPDEAAARASAGQYEGIVGRGSGPEWEVPMYYAPAAPSGMANTVNPNHPAFRERRELREAVVRMDREAATLMRCVQAGVAWRISYGLNKRRALQGQSR